MIHLPWLRDKRSRVIRNSPAWFRNEKRHGGGKELRQNLLIELLKSNLQPRQNAWAFSFIGRFPFFRTICWVVLVCFTTTNFAWAKGESLGTLSPSYKINRLSQRTDTHVKTTSDQMNKVPSINQSILHIMANLLFLQKDRQYSHVC